MTLYASYCRSKLHGITDNSSHYHNTSETSQHQFGTIYVFKSQSTPLGVVMISILDFHFNFREVIYLSTLKVSRKLDFMFTGICAQHTANVVKFINANKCRPKSFSKITTYYIITPGRSQTCDINDKSVQKCPPKFDHKHLD
jgi:hypothetical protein